MTATYTYDDQTFSDLHKEAYGCRPSSFAYGEWKTMTPDQKQDEWDFLLRVANDRFNEEKRQEEEDVAEFERDIAEIIKIGKNCSREQALRWMTPVEPFEHLQDIEQWVWERGILFTEAGKWAVAELKKDL